jgi:hypothetical protein
MTVMIRGHIPFRAHFSIEKNLIAITQRVHTPTTQ